ncbi:MAG: hypothetical protein DCF22_07280 [Leptolyngbya sp.]|nr:MAG: hypothetical protein DCF22_07280 [Leptolyngbya sp.]
MSAAVSSNHDPNSRLPKATQTEKIPGEQEDLTVEMADWQPVKFPDTLSLDEIAQPVLSVSESTQARALNPRENQSDVRKLVDRLQQENSMFRAQINQLEHDLAQAQVELQLEVTRFYCKDATTAIPQSGSLMGTMAQSPLDLEELRSIHQQISQLSQELDSSQKMGHRQQILVETLSEQLQSSQERIAHLERDCAITQQRYNEQVQLVLQAENVCRDLRMRLHRQQRQALQFKAALEKSLEMGSVQGVAIAHADLISPTAPDATPFIPKVQPVQPWSQVAPGTQRYANCRSDGTVLPNLLAKLLPSYQQSTEEMKMTSIQEVELPSIQMPPSVNEEHQSISEVAPVEPSVEAASSLPEVITPEDVSQYMSLIFPRRVESEDQPSAVVPAPQEAVFDLSPFLEAGEADGMTAPAVELRPIAKQILPPLLHPPRPKKSAADSPQPQAIEATNAPALSNSGDRADNLWADLAKLIEPDSLIDNASTIDLSDVTVGRSPAPPNPFQPAANLVNDEVVKNEGISDKKPAKTNSKSDRSPAAKPLSLDFFAYIEKKTTNTQNAQALNSVPQPELKSANVNLSQFEEKTAAPRDPSESIAPSLPPTSDNQPNTSPSPILYPFRPSKKLKSMSAVDLPSFRHAVN